MTVIYKLAEFFNNREGEGIDIGLMKTFIRFLECNLRDCKWCDTLEVMNRPPIDVSIEEIKKIMLPNVSFTGGEPSLYQDDIIDIINSFHPTFFNNISIETNGTIQFKEELLDCIFSHCHSYLFSVSPKFNHINIKILKRFSHYNTQIKFVISDPIEINIIKNMPKQILDCPIILQPVYYPYYTTEQYLEKVRELYDIAPDFCRVIPQMQHILYGNKTGV